MKLPDQYEEVFSEGVGYFSVLGKKVWHTTTPERFEMIISSGVVMPDPPIPDSERWGPTPEKYPFVRRLGAVSVFDLREFNLRDYMRMYGTAGWGAFIPNSHKSQKAIWIEIDHTQLTKDFISASDVTMKYKKPEALGNCIPYMEGAITCEIPVSAFLSVLEYCSDRDSFERIDLNH